MKSKRSIILIVSILCLGVAGWIFWSWYNGPRKEIAEREKLVQEDLKMWSTPISFYGKVMDEKGNTVSGADIKFIVSDTSKEGTTEYHAKSDEGGGFSLTGISGKGMDVRVRKEGYYLGEGFVGSFEYAGKEHNFVPDPKNPVVFPLRKKGEAVALIYHGRSFTIPTDGTPVEVSMKVNGVVAAGQGHIKVECWASDLQARQYDWRCRISVPDGGLVNADPRDPFPFEAPPEGYRPFDEVNMPVSLANNWRGSVTKRYFLKLKDGNYALFNIEVNTKGRPPFCQIDYYLNPSGSRNLEYDMAK
jgi:hypothetical protein